MSEDQACLDALAALEAELTGEPADDLKRMMEAFEAHRADPWGREFALAVGRLMLSRDVVPPEAKRLVEVAVRTNGYKLQETHQSALESLRRGDLDDAERLASELLYAAEAFAPDDADTVCFDVSDELELAFLRETLDNGHKAQAAPVPQTRALIVLAEVGFRRRFGQAALDHLARAVRRNPAATVPRFMRCNYLKQLGRLAEAREEGLQVHALCWLSHDLAWSYHHQAWCESEAEHYETAAALALLSLHHEFHPLGLDELRYAQNAGGLDMGAILPRTLSIVAAAGLPIGPDPAWSLLASNLSSTLQQDGEADRAARYAEIALSLCEPADLSLLRSRLEEVGFLDGWPVASSPQEAWLLRLQASIGGFGIDEDPDEVEELDRRLPPELADDMAELVKPVATNRPPLDDVVRHLGAALLDTSRTA